VRPSFASADLHLAGMANVRGRVGVTGSFPAAYRMIITIYVRRGLKGAAKQLLEGRRVSGCRTRVGEDVHERDEGED